MTGMAMYEAEVTNNNKTSADVKRTAKEESGWMNGWMDLANSLLMGGGAMERSININRAIHFRILGRLLTVNSHT
jgi:hypothetical protein